jgi:hypothetical protein
MIDATLTGKKDASRNVQTAGATLRVLKVSDVVVGGIDDVFAVGFQAPGAF